MLLVSFVGFGFLVLSQELGWEEHLQNYLSCVEWDVIPCSIHFNFFIFVQYHTVIDECFFFTVWHYQTLMYVDVSVAASCYPFMLILV